MKKIIISITMDKQFTYGGYTFEPRGQFSDYGIKSGKNMFGSVSRYLYSINFGKVADGNEDYDYDEFYRAANSDADIFYCIETKELYVPCGKSLQIFDITGNGENVSRRYQIRKLRREPHWQNCQTVDGQLAENEVQNFADEFTSRLLRQKYGALFDYYDDINDADDINRDWEWLNERLYNVIDEWTR